MCGNQKGCDLSETIPSQWSGGSSSPQSQSKLSSILHWDTLRNREKQPISSNLPYIRKTKFKIVYNHNPYEHLANTISLFYGGGIGKWINLIRVLRSYKGYGRERNNLVWTYLKRQDHEYTIQSTAYSVLNVLNEFPAVKRQPSWAMFPVFVWLFMRTISDVSTLSDVMGSYFSSPDFSNHSDRNTRVMD